MDPTGVGLSTTTVWIAPNRLTQGEMSQVETAQNALETAKLRLEAELGKFVAGASVARFVTQEQEKVAEAESQKTALEVAAVGKWISGERIITTDATGGFVLNGLPPGSYMIRAFRRGFEPSRLRD
jgi:hypothetical protein